MLTIGSYSHNLNNGLVPYLNGYNVSVSPMVCYSNGDLNNGLKVRYSDHYLNDGPFKKQTSHSKGRYSDPHCDIAYKIAPLFSANVLMGRTFTLKPKLTNTE